MKTSSSPPLPSSLSVWQKSCPNCSALLCRGLLLIAFWRLLCRQSRPTVAEDEPSGTLAEWGPVLVWGAKHSNFGAKQNVGAKQTPLHLALQPSTTPWHYILDKVALTAMSQEPFWILLSGCASIDLSESGRSGEVAETLQCHHEGILGINAE